MIPAETDDSDADPSPETRRIGLAACLPVALLVQLSFLAYSAVQAPVPGPNEPHYLCKAKHYWNPDYCPDDFFLNSSNAHLVFYETIGRLTLFLSLTQTAWVARVLGYGLLAFGWTVLIARMSRNAWTPLWAAWIFLAITNLGNLSGEWIVGGIEAKIFSYGFLFWAMADMFDRRWLSAGIFAGLAVSFHPVVGCWGVIAAAIATVGAYFQHRFMNSPGPFLPGDWKRPLIGGVLLVVSSLPGILPAVQLLGAAEGVDTARADRIQVFERLAHHLDPTRFATMEWGEYVLDTAWMGYAVFTICALLLLHRVRRTKFDDWFCWFVLATAAIAAVGCLAGWMPRAANGLPDPDTALYSLRVLILKLYPFRLFDVIVPITAAIGFARLLQFYKPAEETVPRSPGNVFVDHAVTATILCGFFLFSLWRPIADRNPSHMTDDELADWIAVCEWVDRELPRDAVVLTPEGNWAFKWYAQRAEYVSYKDTPQDAAGILEWQRRRESIPEWNETYWHDGYSRDALRVLLDEKGITHILIDADIRESMPIAPIYSGETYQIYRLRDALDEP